MAKVAAAAAKEPKGSNESVTFSFAAFQAKADAAQHKVLASIKAKFVAKGCEFKLSIQLDVAGKAVEKKWAFYLNNRDLCLDAVSGRVIHAQKVSKSDTRAESLQWHSLR